MVNKNHVIVPLFLLAAGYMCASESSKLFKIETERWQADQKRLNIAINEAYPMLQQKYTTLSAQDKAIFGAQLNDFHASPLFARYQLIKHNLMMTQAWRPSEEEKK